MRSTVHQYLALCLLATVACEPKGYGDVSAADSALAARGGSRPFDAAAWRAGDRAARGAMVADLIRTHRLHGRPNREVFALLGPTECYVEYEDEPCYPLQIGGRPYALKMRVNHSSAALGTILGVSFVP